MLQCLSVCADMHWTWGRIMSTSWNGSITCTLNCRQFYISSTCVNSVLPSWFLAYFLNCFHYIVLCRDCVLEDCAQPQGQLKDKKLWLWPWPHRPLAMKNAGLEPHFWCYVSECFASVIVSLLYCEWLDPSQLACSSHLQLCHWLTMYNAILTNIASSWLTWLHCLGLLLRVFLVLGLNATLKLIRPSSSSSSSWLHVHCCLWDD